MVTKELGWLELDMELWHCFSTWGVSVNEKETVFSGFFTPCRLVLFVEESHAYETLVNADADDAMLEGNGKGIWALDRCSSVINSRSPSPARRYYALRRQRSRC